MKKYEEELINTKTKYKLQFMETITDEYKKRQIKKEDPLE